VSGALVARSALITGITGQDGSYLAELLLERGYEVHGMVRRASTEKFDRIEHLRERITLHQGDLLDQRSLVDTLRASRPDEIYNLAAMSFVAVSWLQPTLTAEFTGVGVTRMLEAVREAAPDSRFYQASSSEMFGKVLEVPQTETTAFYPRSPYGVAKAYGHFITVNYRESYDLFACCGILFNHECAFENTPLMVRENGIVAVKTPADLVALRRKGPSVQAFEPDALVDVWDGARWTPITAITATRRRIGDPDHAGLCVQSRGGVVDVTAHHHMLDADGEQVSARDVRPGDRLALVDEFPPSNDWSAVAPETGELLGLLAADGDVSRDGRRMRFVDDDPILRTRVTQLWSRCFGGTSAEWIGRSGFDGVRDVHAIDLNGAGGLGGWLRSQLYTPAGLKQVPPLVLNATDEVTEAFLHGYDAGEGLKRGKGESIETNSAILAQGVCWLFALHGRDSSVDVEHRAGRVYYQLNLGTPAPAGMKGAHLRRDPAEVRRIAPAVVPDDEWVFDLETESGVLAAGVGRLVVHNSPRRGLEFVTRKITWHAAAIRHGLRDELALGNLDAQRDWGYAKDYVEAMYLMLQEDDPDDYVIATNRINTVRQCVQIAFDEAGVPDWERYVRLDPAFLRPAEVDQLIGDPAKASARLGWAPRTTFEQLIRLMTRSDLELLKP
jgi:GDPmannose 4,6-dehydratase